MVLSTTSTSTGYCYTTGPTDLNATGSGIYIDATMGWSSGIGSYRIEYDNGVSGGAKKGKKPTRGIHPLLYFKYVKKRFGFIENYRMSKRLERLEKAFYEAVDAGQEVMAEKFLIDFSREFRESAIYAKGVRMFIEKEDLEKHRRNIRDGHISDTLYKDFTRVIPKKIRDKKKKFEGVFDDFVIYHYWNEETEEKVTKKQKMTSEEKSKMRDPILFGVIKESNRLYFIDEWDDEYCDLSFAEIADVIGKEEKEMTLTDKPKFVVERKEKNEDDEDIDN